ncbi:hypothetical protein ACS5NO_32325 [Larkinella sp. GY13]|uniref:hypothetical protein n=1 Tax=Larkinella sp. GY13 TaxID=3453720 RepID=UPI003EEE0249
MKKILFFLVLLLGGNASVTYAQMITNDPIHTGITSLIKMFQDPSFKSIVGNIEKLKKVTSAVRQFHRGTEIVESVTRITKKLSTYSTAIAKDGHIYPVEFALMSKDIDMFTTDAQKLIKDMKSVTTAAGGVLEMTDAERSKWLNDTYRVVIAFESKITRYFNRIMAASIKRSASKADMTATGNLYKIAASVPRGYTGGGHGGLVDTKGYDDQYNDNLKIPLDYLYQTEAYKTFQKQMRECEFKNQMFYKRQEYEAKKMETMALYKLYERGYQIVVKNGFLQSKATSQANFQAAMGIVRADTASYQTSTQSQTISQLDVQQLFENEIMAIFDQNGKRITPEIFQMQVEFLAKELYLEYSIDQQLEKELDLDKCKELSKSFDTVMKAAEEEYLKNN